MCVQTAQAAAGLMSEIQSPRTDEFRAACAARFELSTVFLTLAECAALRQSVVSAKDPLAQMLEEKVETLS